MNEWNVVSYKKDMSERREFNKNIQQQFKELEFKDWCNFVQDLPNGTSVPHLNAIFHGESTQGSVFRENNIRLDYRDGHWFIDWHIETERWVNRKPSKLTRAGNARADGRIYGKQYIYKDWWESKPRNRDLEINIKLDDIKAGILKCDMKFYILIKNVKDVIVNDEYKKGMKFLSCLYFGYKVAKNIACRLDRENNNPLRENWNITLIGSWKKFSG